ncbi:hypothetical protein [Aurantiacibacter aquimixticola]|uniref:Mitochondrial inner membrane protein n=1 Tax=Aurantiacibacter aquimixticola TaxID=1958945 RepID=A0A419RQB5_9SPHN|nr:hypothetical protein [Aurantiacibacter aquimixticola]RJY07960.1 hypothetical protein D6201_00060 [Aurantiacibacter aquimixticola]
MEQGLDFTPAGTKRHKSSMRPVLIAVGGAFLLGVVGTWWLTSDGGVAGLFSMRSESEVPAAAIPDEAAEDDLNSSEPSAAASPEVAAEGARQAAEVERVVEQQGGLDSRVAAMEQRLTRLDIQAQSAAGNAARAEALLIAFASRRVIERGEPLGYLADQLRLRFGETRPRAVQAIVDAAKDPVTLDQLLARLEGLAPQLDDAPDGEGVFTRLGRELSEVFVVRRDETASPVAERRLERARMFLESGRTEAAVSEIRNLPNAAIAQDWIDDAERFAGAQRALEALETAAVLDPRELRDGEGAPVEQRSPAGNTRR